MAGGVPQGVVITKYRELTLVSVTFQACHDRI